MEIVTIENDHNQILRQVARGVEFPLSEENKAIFYAMKEKIAELQAEKPGSLAGLAAPQVGHSIQLLFLEIPEEAHAIRKDVFETLPLTAFFNPHYIPIYAEGTYLDWEGCYSVPNMMGEVRRYHAIQFHAHNKDGEIVADAVRGFFARVLQHEIGHLYGELYTDLLTPDSRFGTREEMLPIRLKEIEERRRLHIMQQE